jgi:hypothetical protein
VLPNSATTPITLEKAQVTGAEKFIKYAIEGVTIDEVSLENGTSTSGNGFIPIYIFTHSTTSSTAATLIGRCDSGMDTGSNPLIRLDGRQSAAALTTRPILGVSTFGSSDKYLFYKDKLVFADAVNIETNTTTGTKIGTAATQKLSFFGATPRVQLAYQASPTVTTLRDALISIGLMAAS